MLQPAHDNMGFHIELWRWAKTGTVSEKNKILRYENYRLSLCALMVSTLHLQEMNACSLQSFILFWFITI